MMCSAVPLSKRVSSICLTEQVKETPEFISTLGKEIVRKTKTGQFCEVRVSVQKKLFSNIQRFEAEFYIL